MRVGHGEHQAIDILRVRNKLLLGDNTIPVRICEMEKNTCQCPPRNAFEPVGAHLFVSLAYILTRNFAITVVVKHVEDEGIFFSLFLVGPCFGKNREDKDDFACLYLPVSVPWAFGFGDRVWIRSGVRVRVRVQVWIKCRVRVRNTGQTFGRASSLPRL